MTDSIALLAAATIINDDPTLDDYRDLDRHDRALLIRDYRDEFASSPAPLLANARLTDELIFDTLTLLDDIAANDDEITYILDKIADIDDRLTATIAANNDLCTEHLCDPDNCAHEIHADHRHPAN